MFLSSLLDIELAISSYREYYQNNFGVSDIYWDVLSRIRNIGIAEQPELINIYQKIEIIINGKVEYTSQTGSVFNSKGKTIDIKLSAAGIKIFGLLQLLIERDILKKDSVLILEEPESHLHPSFCFQLIEILFELKNAGVTIILITHSVEMIRYIEYLVNTQPDNLTDFSLTLLEQIDHCTQLVQSEEKSILPKIMQTLTGDYFNLLLKEQNYFES